MWAQCWQLMKEHPLFGVGPDNWGDYAKDYFGWGSRKEAHSLWMQTGAELGFPGLALLLAFYGSCAVILVRRLRDRALVSESVRKYAPPVLASLAGFAVSASFVTVERLEIPYYVVLVGAAALALPARSGVSEENGLPQLGAIHHLGATS